MAQASGTGHNLMPVHRPEAARPMGEWQPGRGTWNRTARIRRVESLGGGYCRMDSCRSDPCWGTSFISAGRLAKVGTRISVGDPLAATSDPFLRVHLVYFGLVLKCLDERFGERHQLGCSHIRPGRASRTVPAGNLFFVPVPEVKRRGRKRVFSTAFPLALIDRGRERMDFPSIFSIIHHETAEYKQVNRIFD